MRGPCVLPVLFYSPIDGCNCGKMPQGSKERRSASKIRIPTWKEAERQTLLPDLLAHGPCYAALDSKARWITFTTSLGVVSKILNVLCVWKSFLPSFRFFEVLITTCTRESFGFSSFISLPQFGFGFSGLSAGNPSLSAWIL